MDRHFWNALIRGVCYAFWLHPALARRILAAAYVQGRFTLGDLEPLSLQLIARIYEFPPWDPHHLLAADVRDAMIAQSIPPLGSGPLPRNEIPGLDWQRREVASAPSWSAIIRLPHLPLADLEDAFVWIVSLALAQDSQVLVSSATGVVMSLRDHLLDNQLHDEGERYFNGSANRVRFLEVLYERAVADLRVATPSQNTLNALRSRTALGWFQLCPNGPFYSEAERRFVRATLVARSPSGRIEVSLWERLALLLVYRGQVRMDGVARLLAGNAAWATTVDAVADHLYQCFLRTFRSMS